MPAMDTLAAKATKNVGDIVRLAIKHAPARKALVFFDERTPLAKIITTELRAKTPPKRPAFHYHDKGNMATIGRAEAVIATKRFARHGFLAWMLWWLVHIFFLVGFRNRVFMMFHWAWSWLTYKRGSRLITGSIGELPPIRTIADDGTVALPPAGKGELIARPEQPAGAPPTSN